MTATQVPSHLKDYEEIYRADPRAASVQWFRDAKFGLFVHYALASLLRNGKSELMELYAANPRLEDVFEAGTSQELADASIPPETLEKLLAIKREMMSRFTAEAFDADAICDLAVEAGMKYVTLTTTHLGRLFLYPNPITEESALDTTGRDLVKEMVEACARRGLGYFHYVPPEFARTDGDYFERNNTLLRTLLTNYGPVAGIWFDGIGLFYKSPENYSRLSEKFALIRELQPQCLIAFKEGAIGEEDFITPEHFLLPEPVEWNSPARQRRWDIRLARWREHNAPTWDIFKDKPAEINTTMQACKGRDDELATGGWINEEDARHLSADEVWFLLGVARSKNANLLMNIGPRGDGSIHPDDARALRAVGQRVRESGFPGE